MTVAVVGGGISGLSCAYYLGKAGIDAVVFDPSPGGLIGSVKVEGCTLETGPESWLVSKPWAETLVRELGMGDQIMGSNDPKRRTFILRQGKFQTLPEGLQLVVPTKPWPVLKSELFTWGTKLRMGTEVFRNPKALPDRSVSEFVADHFGQEAVDYLAEPLLAGVYGGSPDNLSAPSVLSKFVEYEQRFGSVVVGAMREKKPANGKPVFYSLRNGMGTMIDALRSRVNIVREPVMAIQPGEQWSVYVDGQWLAFDHIVLAAGAYHSAPLLSPVNAEAGDLMASIPHTSSVIWTMGYQRSDISHPLDAFGFLIPKKERQTIMACTWIATKWLGRVPDDKAVLRCFSDNPDATQEEIQADLKRLMGVTAAPAFSFQNKAMHAMPQYTVGHSVRIEELEARMADIPGLHLAGNAYHGIGIPDCVRSGKRVAETIASSAARLTV